MEWKKYEEITKHIYEELGKNSGVKIVCFGSECKIVGKSTVTHQIDVLTSYTDGIHTYKTAIECKYWDKNVNKDTIMKVAEIVEDAQINKGVIVSKQGFTPDAISYAKYKNIGLIELREFREEDWQGRLRNISFKTLLLNPKLTGLDIGIDKETSPTLHAGKTTIGLLNIKYPSGNIENLSKLADEFIKEVCKLDEGETFEKTYQFEKGTLIIDSHTTAYAEITEIKLKGLLEISESVTEIKGEDQVLMIMRSIFEEKSFTLFKDGEIRER
jgi:hypothetical protein